MGVDATRGRKSDQRAGPDRKTSQCSHHLFTEEEKDESHSPSNRSYFLKIYDGKFRETSLLKSLSCRISTPTRPLGMDVQRDEVIGRRGSVYQSSREVRNMKEMQLHRRKLNPTHNSEACLSFEVTNTSLICQKQGRKCDKSISANSLSTSDQNFVSLDTPYRIDEDSPDFLDLSFHNLEKHSSVSDVRTDSLIRKIERSDNLLVIAPSQEDSKCHAKEVSEIFKKGLCEASKLKYNETPGYEINGTTGSQGGKANNLLKSSSTKVGMLNSLDQVDNDTHGRNIKSRFSLHRRILDPITRSKSYHNQSLSRAEVDSALGAACRRRKNAVHISSSHDSVRVTHVTESQHIDLDKTVPVSSSPVHLNGMLTLEHRAGFSYFEFFLKDRDDIFSAKTCKTHGSFNWVYTFHKRKRINNRNDQVVKDTSRHSQLLIGQMQVSCYLYSELCSNHTLVDSTTMEFVSYDISQSMRSVVSNKKSDGSPEAIQSEYEDTNIKNSNALNSVEMTESLDTGNCKHLSRCSTHDPDSIVSDSQSWESINLLPHMEIAAIVIQIPFGPKEIAQDAKMIEKNVKDVKDVLDGRVTNLQRTNISMKVVTPTARHGLPTADGCPLPLLDRWRSGGSCDCGGWDMGCPIIILDYNGSERAMDYSSGQSCYSFKLSVQGSKDTIPAVTITRVEDREYSVHFHAQFTALQAFSICVAILHSIEYSSIVEQEKSISVLPANSLRKLLEDEMRNLLDIAAEKETCNPKRMEAENVPACYVLDPPFSPIGRV